MAFASRNPAHMMRAIALFIMATYPAASADQITINAQRLSDQPLLRPGSSWAEFALFNSAAIKAGAETVLLFCAQDRRL